jgi:hypothetical protein
VGGSVRVDQDELGGAKHSLEDALLKAPGLLAGQLITHGGSAPCLLKALGLLPLSSLASRQRAQVGSSPLRAAGGGRSTTLAAVARNPSRPVLETEVRGRWERKEATTEG